MSEELTVVFTDKKKGWKKVGNDFKEDDNVIIQTLYVEEIEEFDFSNATIDIRKGEYENKKIKTMFLKVKEKEQIKILKKLKENIIKECIKANFIKDEDVDKYDSIRNMEFSGRNCIIKIDVSNIKNEDIKNVKLELNNIRIDKNKKTLNILMEIKK